MSIRANGSYLGFSRTPSTSQDSASGIWDLRTAERQRRAAAWPALYDADAQAYFNRVEGPTGDNQTLEIAVKTAINDFIAGCKADGIWNSIKASCILVGARTLSGALQPLTGAAPTNFNFVGGDYNRKTGLKGDGSTKYLNSNRANSDDPQDSQHLSVFVTEFRTTGSSYMGTGGTAAGTSALGTGFARSRNSAADGFAAPTGFVGISRGSSADYQARASSTDTTFSRLSETPLAGDIFVYARNINGPSVYSDPRLAFFSIGESIDLAALDSRLSALMTAIDEAFVDSPATLTITQQPQNTTASGGEASFAVTATVSDGSVVSYQWEQSTDAGATWSSLAGETSSTLNLTGLTTADDGERYRVVVSSAYSSPVTSASATLTVDPVVITITQQPQDATAVSGSATFSVSATVNNGIEAEYQWEKEQVVNDAAIWNAGTLPSTEYWRFIVYGNGTFLAIASVGTTAVSVDRGISWTASSLTAVGDAYGAAFGNGQFAVSRAGSIDTSSDGLSWTSNTISASGGYGLAMAYGADKWVRLRFNSATYDYGSGSSWAQGTLPLSSGFSYLKYGNGVFVGMSTSGDCVVSASGTSWSATALPSRPGGVAPDILDLAFGNGIFVAIYSSDSRLATPYDGSTIVSEDGYSWAQHAMPSGFRPGKIDFGGGVFVMTGADGLAKSTDGVNWEVDPNIQVYPGLGDIAHGDGTFVSVLGSSQLTKNDYFYSTSGTLAFAALSGETSQELALTGLNAANDGERYRVVVDSPSAEPVTSNVATLSVDFT